MTSTINWNTLSIEEWENKFSLVPRSNILQSYTYARAYCPIAKQRARWGLIVIDGREAGLAQMFEAGILWNLFHAVMLDRGPLWFEGFGTALHVKRFFDEWNKQFPRRFGRKRRVIPETEAGPSAEKLIGQTGLMRENREGYQTIWMDLKDDAETLRANLKQKWRNSLNKAERACLQISWDNGAETVAWILAVYAADKSDRGYGGPSPDLLKHYLPLLAAKGDLHIARTMQDGTVTAFVVFAAHGRSATYLVGWSSLEGRENSAHHLLLWEGALMLQQRGIKDLDLGGINDESGAEGIKLFKEGLGGKTVRYAGVYS